jgi:hypothetical protein
VLVVVLVAGVVVDVVGGVVDVEVDVVVDGVVVLVVVTTVVVVTVGAGGVLATVAVAQPVRTSSATAAAQGARRSGTTVPGPRIAPGNMMGRTLLIGGWRVVSPGRRLRNGSITIR